MWVAEPNPETNEKGRPRNGGRKSILIPECGNDQVYFREDIKTIPQAKKID